MSNAKATDAKVTGYALIINKDGMPCIAEPLSVPDEVWNSLTESQKMYANDKVTNNLKRFN